MSTLCYIGLGSNLDDPKHQVRQAIATITNTTGIQLLKSSSLYQTKPVGPQDQPNFINAVIECKTILSAEALLKTLLSIEQQQGRIRNKNQLRWGPRIIDLDILLYGHARISLPHLTIPHPEMMNRDFVLTPLIELNPDLYAILKTCTNPFY